MDLELERTVRRKAEVSYELSALAWERPIPEREVDLTWRIDATLWFPTARQHVWALAHTRARTSADAAVHALEPRWVEDAVRSAFANDDRLDTRTDEARVFADHWHPCADAALAPTRAPQFEGRARAVLDAALGLASADWMQDWPLEVADPSKIPAAIRLYETNHDEAVRFDAMSFVLHSSPTSHDPDLTLPWIERTLTRDFALHGHTVSYWAWWNALDHEDESERDGRAAVSPSMRRVFAAATIPLRVVR
jgi:hypothetical protein